MGVKYTTKRYSEQKENEIRCSIIAALKELANFNGIDINTIKTTAPYSLSLCTVTSQKMASELKKLIDEGIVVKEAAKGHTVKYMLKQTYQNLINDKKFSDPKVVHKDYLDKNFLTEEENKKICFKIKLSSERIKYDEMW